MRIQPYVLKIRKRKIFIRSKTEKNNSILYNKYYIIYRRVFFSKFISLWSLEFIPLSVSACTDPLTIVERVARAGKGLANQTRKELLSRRTSLTPMNESNLYTYSTCTFFICNLTR